MTESISENRSLPMVPHQSLEAAWKCDLMLICSQRRLGPLVLTNPAAIGTAADAAIATTATLTAPIKNNGYAYQRGSNAPTAGYRSYNGYNGNGDANDRAANSPAPMARSYNGRYNGDPRNGNANGSSRLGRNASLADDPGPFTPEGNDVALKPAADAPMPHRVPRPQDQQQ